MAKKIDKNNAENAAKELARAKSALRRELTMEEQGVEKKLSPLAEKKKQKRKKKFKQAVIIFIVGLFGYAGWWLLKPFQESMEYGICKIFAELTLTYPDTVYYSEVVRFQGSIRVWYSYTDSFGEFRLEPIQCYFGAHEKFGMGLTRVTMGRREVDPAIVERFNNALPALFAYPPDLIYPTPLPNDPASLQFNTDRFRKSIF